MDASIRTPGVARIVVPDEKLASDTIGAASIRNRETFAEVIVPVPYAADLGVAVDGLLGELADGRDARVSVSAPAATATLSEAEPRVRRHRRLHTSGVRT